MFGFIRGVIDFALLLCQLAAVAYLVIDLMNLKANKWTELLRSVLEPVLAPIRVLLNKHLPRKYQTIDWSPVALVIALALLRWII